MNDLRLAFRQLLKNSGFTAMWPNEAEVNADEMSSSVA
jgi:hypothetical protein